MIKLMHGDCLDLMRTIEPGSVDLIATDLPYGTTRCKWDVVIPFEPLWDNFKRVLKPRGVVLLFGSQPFTSFLVTSNIKWFKYEIMCNKSTRAF
jgi:DNA modification methylase